MANNFQFGLVGVSGNVRLGKDGSRLRNSGDLTAVEIRNKADTAFARLRAADPVGLDDVVTKRYLETQANVIVTGQIDGGSPPAVVNGVMYICTTAGGTFNLGDLYFGENGVWNPVVKLEGMTVSVTDNLTGGTLTFSGDHRYLWDADGSAWVDLGPAPSETRVVKTYRATLAFGTGATTNVGSPLPVDAVVNRVLINVSQAFNGTAPTVTVGVTGALAEVAASAEIDLATVGLYIVDLRKSYVANEQLLMTYAADSSTAGAAQLEVFYSLV